MKVRYVEGNHCKESIMHNSLVSCSTQPNKVGCPSLVRKEALRKQRRRKLHKSHPPSDELSLWNDTPPICLWSLWCYFNMTVVGSFHLDAITNILFTLLMSTWILATAYKSFCLILKWQRDFCRPELQTQSGISRIDPYLKEAIQVWCLFECLKDSKTKRGMIAAITQYLQAHVKESIFLYAYRQVVRCETITDWTSPEGVSKIEEMLGQVFNSTKQEEEIEMTILETNSSGIEEEVPWHVAVDNAFGNWKRFRESAVAIKFFNLVNVIVSAGMCSTANLEFKVGDVHLFSPIVAKKQLVAGDVFEAFYEAVSGFMKGGWRVYKTGSVSAFFMEDDDVTAFEKSYNEIRAWHGYALAGNLREYTEIDDNEYELKVKNAIEFGDILAQKIKKGQTFEKKYVTDRVDKLRDYYTEFTQLRTKGGLRIAPFAISLFGRSGAGKSTLTNLTVNAGLVYNELSAEKDRIATWADNDKFASSIRSHINAIIFDDFANTKGEFMDFSPAYRLIQVINNIKYLAPMADVFLKGKVSLNPYFCIVSTNVEHLNAAQYSNEPESVLRRMYHVKVEPKETFLTGGVLDSAKIEKRYGHIPCPDVWNLTIRQYEAANKRHVDLARMKPVRFRGKKMENVSVHVYLKWVQETSKKHFESQEQYLENQEGVPTKCGTCNYVYCKCAQKLDPHAGVFEDCYEGMQTWMMRRSQEFQNSMARLNTTRSIAAYNVCLWFRNLNYMPDRFLNHPRVLAIGLLFWREDIMRALVCGNCSILFLCACLVFTSPFLLVFWFSTAVLLMYWYTCATIRVYTILVRGRILRLRNVVQTYVQSWQFKYAIIGLGAIGIVLALLRSRYESTLEANGGLTPTTIEEIEERNSEVNPWIQNQKAPLPMEKPAKTSTAENLAGSMKTNLIGIVSESGKTTLGFYICSNFLVVPTHFLNAHPTKDIPVKCYKTGADRVGSYFRDKLAQEYTVHIPKTDFSICFVTGGGSMKNYLSFLPTAKELRKVPAMFVSRDIIDTELNTHRMLYKGSGTVRHTEKAFEGSYYEVPFETKPGMCMSPILSNAKGSVILGFHLGGKGKLGGCGTLLKQQAEDAVIQLAAVDGVVLSASNGNLIPEMGNFPSKFMGKEILTSTDVHYKSATNYLPEGACVDVYGSTTGKATPHSNVASTLISDTVEEVFGVKQKWGPPKMSGKGRYPYQATLQHAAVPSLPIGSILKRAVRSIKDLTNMLKDAIPELFEAGPLSRVATVSGLAGVRFIDAMNFNTSPGFPLTGDKHPLLVDLDPEEYPEVGKPRTFVDEVWREFDEIVEILMSGVRCYLIWKACLKDESTDVEKDKVRVFQSAPLVMQLLIRMYFLPIVRIIQLNPVLYECAVGVNAESQEWEQLWEAAMQRGRDRVLAGDYSKYDVRMPAQVTIAAFDILIDIAEKCEGYTERDLKLMRMMVNEVVYPVLAYNGDLIQLFGTNPSGQNLTVIINSLVNSLLLRSCFYTIYPEGDFHEAAVVMTYGDDVIGSVSANYPKFTHITYANWLAEHDMKFTMPDKESEPKHYMTEEEVDFLKRKNTYNPDLGINVGLLSEQSIFKRLHSHVLSKELSLEEHSAANIESSIHDWFYYGREVFEDRQEKLKQVAEKCGILEMCPALCVSYDKRVNHWRHKYLGEDLIDDEEKDPILETQCGDMYVSTVDYLDHCRGTGYDPFFWWEHLATDVSIIFELYLVHKLAVGDWEFRRGRIDKRWLVIVLFLTRWKQLVKRIIREIVLMNLRVGLYKYAILPAWQRRDEVIDAYVALVRFILKL